VTNIEIPKISNSKFLADLNDVLDWMRLLNVDIAQGRLTNYRRAAKHWVELVAGDLNEAGRLDLCREVTSAAFEVSAFFDIYSAFKDEKISNLGGIAAKLKKAVAGPVDLDTETSASNAARNFLFEAITAAKIHNPAMGVKTIFNAESDTGFELGTKRVWVECKRLSSAGQVQSNVSKACKQLKRTLDKHPQTGQRGVVALDISKLVTLPPPGHILELQQEADIGPRTEAMLDKYIKENSQEWQQKYLSQDSRIIGTLFRLSLIATSVDKEAYISVSQWGINPRRGIQIDDERLFHEMVRCFNKGRGVWLPGTPA
jgi:hypothetical protein